MMDPACWNASDMAAAVFRSRATGFSMKMPLTCSAHAISISPWRKGGSEM